MTSSRQTLPTTVVYDYLYKAGDATATTPAPLSGAEVRITLQYDRATTPSPLTYVAPQTVVVTTDSNGYWTANLVPNSGTSGLSPSNTLYTVQTPYSVYQISVPTTGGPYQSSSIIANGVSALAPATTNLTGPLTVAGLLTAQAGEALTGALTMADAASKVIPGATSFSVRDTANANDNLFITNAGAVMVRGAISGVTTLTATTLAGTLGTAAQPNVTSVGTLTSLAVTGAVTSVGSTVGAGTLGYAQATVNQTGISAQTDLTSLTATVTVGAGRRIRVSCYGLVQTTVANDAVDILILEGATVLQQIITVLSVSGGNGIGHCTGSVILTPSATSHTYKLAMSRFAGTGTESLIASTTNPAYILVEDIGT